MILALGCDDDQNNADCERDCVRDYLQTIDSCENQIASCIEGCSSTDDASCIWDCEASPCECDVEIQHCMGGCPCAERTQDCASGCGPGDIDCIESCMNKYLDCAGEDSPHNCFSACIQLKGDCLWDCEETLDMEAYPSCRADCHQAFVGCLYVCV